MFGDGGCGDPYCFNCTISIERAWERVPALKDLFKKLPTAPAAKIYNIVCSFYYIAIIL